MRISYGVTALARGLADDGIDGIGHYTQSLFKSLNSTTDVELLPYSFGIDLQNDELSQPLSMRGRLAYELLQSAANPWQRWNADDVTRVDLVHATDHIIPLVRDVPLLATIMDAIPLSHPEWTRQSLMGRTKSFVWRRLAQRADHIVTISNYSKARISQYFKIPAHNISVIYPGVEPEFFKAIEPTKKLQILNHYRLEKPFILNLSLIHI